MLNGFTYCKFPLVSHGNFSHLFSPLKYSSDYVWKLATNLTSVTALIYLKLEKKKPWIVMNPRFYLCGWRDSNPHASRHKILSLACLPIPPHPRSNRLIIPYLIKKFNTFFKGIFVRCQEAWKPAKLYAIVWGLAIAGKHRTAFVFKEDSTLWTWGNRIFVNGVKHGQLVMLTVTIENARAVCGSGSIIQMPIVKRWASPLTFKSEAHAVGIKLDCKTFLCFLKEKLML